MTFNRIYRAALLAFALLTPASALAQSAPFNSSSVSTLGGNCGLQGSVMFQSANGVSKCIGAGGVGQVLQGAGAGADVTWQAVTTSGSQAASSFYASPTAVAGVPAYRPLVAADISNAPAATQSALTFAPNVASGFIGYSGALGTPTSGVLTNATGLPIASGVSGLGAGTASALAIAPNVTGGFVGYSGALGTPTSGVLTNATGLPIASGVSGLGAGVAASLANIPNSASGFLQGTLSGNTTKFATGSGAFTNGHSAGFDVNGNIADSGYVNGSPNYIYFYPSYCADNTGATDCTTGFNSALALALSSSRCLYIAAGSYKIASNIDWNLHSNPSAGFCVIGNSRGNPGATKLVFTAATGASWLIHGNTSDSIVFGHIEHLAITGNTSGATLQIGNIALDDSLNELQLNDLFIANGSSSGTADALMLNSVLNGFVNVVANGGGYTTSTHVGAGFAALDCNQCIFDMFMGSYGNSGTGILLRNGSNYGNTFVSADMEAATSNVTINNSASVNNTWIGGTISLSTNGIAAAAGAYNVFLNTYFNPTVTNKVSGSTGLWLKTPGYNFVSTPTVPASTVSATNTYGQTALVTINGGAVSLVSVNGAGRFSVATNTYTIVLNPGDTVALTYTSAPAWVWSPLQ